VTRVFQQELSNSNSRGRSNFILSTNQSHLPSFLISYLSFHTMDTDINNSNTTTNNIKDEVIVTGKSSEDFRAMLSNTLVLEGGLRGISSGKRDQHAICEIEMDGIKFTTTDPSK
jgi:hypothetical protein